MKKIFYFIIFTIVFGCKKTTINGQQPASTKLISYTESNLDFANPERGFYRYSETKASNFVSLDVSELKGYRQEQSLYNANYKVLSTLVFRYYVLDGLTNAPLPTLLLNQIRTDFDIARFAGVKLIPRFVYTVTANPGTCPESFICPPYGDAPKDIMLQHIAQLKSILIDNADVMACLQMGFIGTWGENYYTDYFGDPSSNGNQGGKLLDINWQDRIDIVNALLDAIPKNRMLQIRYPQLKQRTINGLAAATTSAPLTEAEAFGESNAARLGYHNDCFLSSSNDMGTYEDYGSSSTQRTSDPLTVSNLRYYAKTDGRYVVVGGETCDDAFNPQNDCGPAGIAEKEMAEMHYSFINAHYNTQVNNDWQTGGCMTNIKKKLGYRFVLKNATFPKTLKSTEDLKISIKLENVGYASPYNPRTAYLLLRNTATGALTKFELAPDVRKWFPGEISIEKTFATANQLLAGEYEILLSLPDSSPSIATRPEYAIRLANNDVWEEQTGFNKLNFTLQVQ